MKHLAHALFALAIATLPELGYAQLPVARVTGPRIQLGSDAELHRIHGAALLPDGRVAIADAGNSRVVAFSPTGAVERTFGREGSGPGDFQLVMLLVGIGDTIVTWDSGLSRMALWRADGSVIRTVSLPAAANHVVEVEAVRSATEYVSTLRRSTRRPGNGLYLDSTDVLLVSAGSPAPASLGRHAWSYSYFYGEGSGTSSFRTPFLGKTIVAAASGKLFTLPLGTSDLETRRRDGSAGATIHLPVSRPDARARAKRYGDSLIASVPERDRDPNWVRRIHGAFGPDFPAATPAVVQRSVTTGPFIWYQTYPEPADSATTWYIIDADAERLVARAILPKAASVLGGNGRQILVLLRDADDVETVGLFDVTIPR